MYKNNLEKIVSRLIILMVFIVPLVSLAANPPGAGTVSGLDSSLNPLGYSSLTTLINNILKAALNILIPIAALYLVYAGYLFVSAGGDPKQINEGKETLKWALIGIAVLVGARGIISVVEQTITGIGS